MKYKYTGLAGKIKIYINILDDYSHIITPTNTRTYHKICHTCIISPPLSLFPLDILSCLNIYLLHWCAGLNNI